MRALGISPDGGTVITGSFDYTARLWDFVEQNEIAALDELNGRIESAMKQFTLKERQLLLLRLDLELSYPEIAQIMGAPETTVKSRFYSTVKRLRAKIQETEEVDRRCYQ